ncbi:PDR/VanB family oxidoreductase [Paenirhodobacter hankyongi]|uniref:Oxidoreductase n=1 Tax=Paenirhodobacter hankyongi TaxID=2294033 RepID=A0A421BKN9_9RHOB|nr:PDR/VanB family oxidoreductase [Sinirhodobacter hankyongi]RLL62825.1 oxidoreductase [Sinirhodobacter hankyongi]
MTADRFLLRITRIAPLAEGVLAITLAAPDGAPLPAAAPGAHVEIEIPGVGLRPYSLTGDDPRRYEIAVALAAPGRGGSRRIHDGWRVGDEVRVSAPRDGFGPARANGPALLIAGGIGITPMLTIRRALIAAGRPVTLHHAARGAGGGLFPEALRAAPGAPVWHYDTACGPRPDLAALACSAPAGTEVWCCGPARMIDAALAAFAARPDVVLHVERFTAPAAPETPPADAGAFTVALARSGHRFTVAPHEPLLERLRAEGVLPETSCEGGVCGTCLTRVLGGAIAHHDYYLSAAEQAAGDRMLVCVSRGQPGTTLVLDL